MDEKTISLADLSSYCLVRKKDWDEIKKLTRELSQELKMWKEKYEELKREYESSRPSVTVIAMEIEKNEKYEKLKGEYEELKRKYDLLRAESATLAYMNDRIKQIAETECPEIAAFLERMKLMREQSIKDIMERAKRAKAVPGIPCPDPDDDDYAGWGNTFEQAAQKSSHEDWEQSKHKAEEE